MNIIVSLSSSRMAINLLASLITNKYSSLNLLFQKRRNRGGGLPSIDIRIKSISPTTVLYPDIYGLRWIYFLLSIAGYTRLIYWYYYMFGSKLFGLVLSALISVTPINFTVGTEQNFPFTRTDNISWTMTAHVYDMGTTTPVNAMHTYMITYEIEFNCNSVCYYAGSNTPSTYGYNVNNNTVKFVNYSRVRENYSTTLIDNLNSVSYRGQSSSTFTYTNESSQHVITITVGYVDNQSGNINIAFPAVTEGMLISDIAYNTYMIKDRFYEHSLYELEFMNWYMKTQGKALPSSIQTQYDNYINNGEYQNAYTLINNYYTYTSETDNTTMNNIVNNYNSKDTELNNYYNTENNFTNQIETDFQNQEQQLPDLDDAIDELQTPSFLSSANWVTQQFNRMTSGNIFGSFLVFSLLTGFIMALIGRFKR